MSLHLDATGEASDGEVRRLARVVWRNRALVLLAMVVVPLTAVVVSLRQERLYEGSAAVLLSDGSVATRLDGAEEPGVRVDPQRVAQTQADVARQPRVVARALDALGLRDRSPRDVLDAAGVEVRPNSDVLDITARDPDPLVARRLATEIARQFTRYRRELDTRSLRLARRQLQERIASLRGGGAEAGLRSRLADKEQELGTLETLQTANAFVIREADEARQVQPRPVRNGILGLIVGVALGVLLAFLRSSLDTRVRSPDEAADRLGLPLLARIPAPSRELARRGRLVMTEAPHGAQSEVFRLLRTNLRFSALSSPVKAIMVTSATQGEGKSTTVANLAVALARSGSRVALVDLDLRDPIVHRFFDLEPSPGVTHVALGSVGLEDALRHIPLDDGLPTESSVQTAVAGLDVLPAGLTPPDVGEFVETDALAEVVGALREGFDFVLIDAPPVLSVPDALALSRLADALIVVARISQIRRPLLDELARALEACPGRRLGVVATGTELSPGAAYGYGRYVHAERNGSPREYATPGGSGGERST